MTHKGHGIKKTHTNYTLHQKGDCRRGGGGGVEADFSHRYNFYLINIGTLAVPESFRRVGSITSGDVRYLSLKCVDEALRLS